MTEQEYICMGNLTKISAAQSLVRDIAFFNGDDEDAVRQQASEQTAILRQLGEWEERARSGLNITNCGDHAPQSK